MQTSCSELVLKADVECGVGVGCECHPSLPNNIFRSSIFIAHCILDLAQSTILAKVAPSLVALGKLTCILTICPSPFCPSTIAVTSTSVSFPTKFRMHLSYLLLWPVCAARSNLSAREKGRRRRDRRTVERRDRCAMIVVNKLKALVSRQKSAAEVVLAYQRARNSGINS